MVLYDIQQQKTIAELNSPPVKYVVWSNDGSLVALMSKHSEFEVPLWVIMANKKHSHHDCQQDVLAAYIDP